jgi:glycosyltransferase involved in cell wall biosynthesis
MRGINLRQHPLPMFGAVTSAERSPGAGRLPKIALVSIGIGRVQRGFERYFSDIFGVLRSELDITLYKGSGEGNPRERVPMLFGALTPLARCLPFGVVVGGAEYRHYKHDCVAYSLSLIPELVRRRYDVVHVIDYPLMRALERLSSKFGLPGRLLFTNGCCMPPPLYPRVAHVHHVAKPLFLEALSQGVPEQRMTLAPCGFHSDRFQARASRLELRRKHRISENTFVILVVSAVKRRHKRVDHVIEEVAASGGDLLLWVDGNPEDSELPELALQKLGDRCRFTHVPSSTVGELYHCADVLVHGALEESFALAVVEALSTGLLVLMHDSPHFQWLAGDVECFVNMAEPGRLAARLRELMARPELVRRSPERSAEIRRRFDWQSLKPTYLEMYRKVADAQ